LILFRLNEAIKAYKALNTRYYAGRMVQCQFVNIPSWSDAICGNQIYLIDLIDLSLSKGLSEYGKCPKGRRCNYLHVFRNPSLKSDRESSRSKRKAKRSKSRDRSKKKKKSHHWLFFSFRYFFFSTQNMTEDNNTTTNNNTEQYSVFSEQDKELASKAKQEYEGGQFDGLC
jgi:hypothetical protein